MKTLRLEHISKSYQQHTVIEGLDLYLNEGEFVVVVGPSGCGKSTLLRMVAGLEAVSSGDIWIGDEMMTHQAPKDRDIAMVFQNYALYPHMTVFDNIAYGLKVRHVAKAEIMARVNEIACLLKIEELLQRKPAALSGGQRQRVAMGRAIIRNPKLFLFDEPLSNLDAKLRVDMRLEIKKLQQKLGITSLYVTHDQVEAMTMADRIIVMNKGKIDQIARPRKVYRQPATVFVASFIGSPAMNFVPAHLSADGIVLDNGNHLSAKLHQGHQTGRAVLVGIRPERLRVVTDSAIAEWVMRLDTIEHLGAETLLYGTEHDSQQRLTVKIGGYWSGEAGELIHLQAQEKHLHVFDPETERRLHLEGEELA